MINNSFQLIRTNPLLTTNLKVVVTSDYKLYMESFNSNNELSNVRYKHFSMQKTDYLENKIPYFYKELPIDIAFDVRYDNDNKVIQSEYSKQFDTTYYAGASYIEDQWYNEEFEYLAPLYIRKNNLPNGFIILRVDDPSSYNLNVTNNYELNSLSASNFNDIVDNWKCIKYFDMTYSSNLGQWIYNNYTTNNRFPKTSFEYHPERAEFSYWYGMDYTSGIYTNKPIFMDDRDEIETPHFRWEKFITEGYKRSNLIFPYILNLKFLFDDTPATPSSLKKYSMNRYYGFYVDQLDFVCSITSYRTPTMKPDIYLINNIVVSGFTGITEEQLCRLDYFDIPSVNPFIEKWDDSKQYFVFIDNTNDFYRTKTISGLYQIKKVLQNNTYVYKVMSDEILDDYWYSGYTNDNIYNSKTVDINYGKFNILSGLTSDFSIDEYIDCGGNDKYMYGDLYLIKINDMYHVIKYSSGLTVQNELTINPTTGDFDDYKYYIQTDYAINLNSKYLEYWILGKNSEYYNKLQVENDNLLPLSFPIYRIKFSDIKDFDFDRVNTGFSDFDYEKSEYVDTVEEKLYAFDYNDPSIPPGKRVGKLGSKNQSKIDNISSEYIADDELYEVFDLGQQNTFSNTYGDENKLYELTDIWRKNQSVVKWGFMGSISHSDYPYKLNNNYEVGGVYNRTTNPFYSIPDMISKNIDYFYRLGNFYNGVSGDTYYKNQTTNIQYDYISGQLGDGFDIEAYFGGKNGDQSFDYFTFFFKNKMYYENNATLYTKSYDKYSIFNYGDSNVPSVTLFKGLKIKLKEVKNIYVENNAITKVLYGNGSYNNYKLSIILNENYNGVDTGLLNNNNYVDTTTNSINIIMNEEYKNVLVILNVKLSGDSRFNDLSIFKEKESIYYGQKKDGTYIRDYNPNIFTAFNFINAINDFISNYRIDIKYYFIRKYDDKFYHGKSSINPLDFGNSTMTNIPNWKYQFTPFMINIETPVGMVLNNNCYSTYPYYVNSVDDDYVATILDFDELKSSKTQIYRFPGPYEPIFKDINLFRGGYFCYNNVIVTPTENSGTTNSNASFCDEDPDYSLLGWTSFQMCSTQQNVFVEMNVQGDTNLISSRFLRVRGFDFSNIPSDASISGITVTITRKSFANNTDIFVKDNKVYLAKNCLDTTKTSENRGKWDPIDPLNLWSTSLIDVTYGNYNDVWGDLDGWTGSTLKGSDVSDSNFGVLIKIDVKNTGLTSTLLPQIKCVRMNVQYTYNTNAYSADRTVYFDNNYKFDTTLDDFAKIDELIYSKVNETTDILKYSPDIYHIYPCVDEFGYEYGSRFIFKSSWDKEFFIRTNSNLKMDSGTV